MNEKRAVRISKYLARHLRHDPQRIGITLDPQGWVETDTLLAAAAAHGFPFTRAELEGVVAANDKRRYTIEGTRIRANQGHTVEVDLGLPDAEPPAYLFHGTVSRSVAAIRTEGLRPMARHAEGAPPGRRLGACRRTGRRRSGWARGAAGRSC